MILREYRPQQLLGALNDVEANSGVGQSVHLFG